jgi:hypothetical protein
LIGFNFNLKNPVTINRLNTDAATMVRRVNDGTKFYLKRIIAAGVDEGVSSQEIAARIAEGQGLDEILRESELVAKVTNRARGEIEQLTPARLESIVNTEISRAEGAGRIGQWKQMGLKNKTFNHTGLDIPCSFCRAAIDEGVVDIDFGYTDVFGGKVLHPPLHPSVDHCHIQFSEKELISRAGELDIWAGE